MLLKSLLIHLLTKYINDVFANMSVNAYNNDIIVCDYDKVSEFTKDIDLSVYKSHRQSKITFLIV